MTTPAWVSCTAVTANEVHYQARNLVAHAGATRHEQVILLASLLNVAGSVLNTADSALRDGLPLVKFTYRKATDAAPRYAGADYIPSPGLHQGTHIGRVVRVARNAQDGHVYLALDDGARAGPDAPGYTSMRLEGITTVALADPAVQRAAMANIRAPGVARTLYRQRSPIFDAPGGIGMGWPAKDPTHCLMCGHPLNRRPDGYACLTCGAEIMV